LLAADHFARYVIFMTGYLSLYHLCIAALLAGCASIPQLDAGEPATKQAGAHPAFLSARDLRAAVSTDQPSHPAAEPSRQAQLDQRAKALRKRNLTGE
jgi:uncharacterized protein YceK